MKKTIKVWVLLDPNHPMHSVSEAGQIEVYRTHASARTQVDPEGGLLNYDDIASATLTYELPKKPSRTPGKRTQPKQRRKRI